MVSQSIQASTQSGGRIVAATDALGNTTKYQYNNLNLVTQVTDAQGNNTSFAYDPNGNLHTLTDANNHTTTYTYDNMDRVQTRTDPLMRSESYTYDANGNLSSLADRKGQTTAFSYDGINRAVQVGFGASGNSYQSTIAYTYDAGNRMTKAVDSVGGTITDAYDNLDRLTSETTAQGSITYGYDNASRRTSMQVAGQPAVSYGYDNASRLTQISQSSSTTGLGYDNANRRTSLTLPNNVVVSYSYNNDSRITGITYQYGSNTLGNLTYSYDQAGRRNQVGGSFARTGLPGAVASASYDAANELTNWNGIGLSYDSNGNMLSDGSKSFTWNARNQVATLNNVSLQYDAFGRRTQNLAGISFLFDGANAVQELSGTTVTANELSGGVDEIFSRSDSSGAFTQLKDALGSTIALADSNGNVQTSYTYDPYGNTSVTGTSNANEFQYTGRENEGNGLYFYRNRYYSPFLGRFISEDPLGFAGDGPNFYSYVLDSATNFTDPFGLQQKGGGTGVLDPPATSAPPPAAPVPEPMPEPPAPPRPPVLPFCVANPELCVGAVGAAATGAIVYYGGSATVAAVHANNADQELLQAIHNWNQAVLAKNRAQPPLAGRYAFQPSDEDAKECNKQWKNAADYCSQLDDLPRDSPEWKKVKKIFGGSIFNCMKGQVSERCGGNKVIP